MWCDINPYDWLNKFCNIYMVAIVGTISRRGFRIEVCCRKQPHYSELSLYKHSFCFKNYLKQLYKSNKIECFSYKVGVVWHVSRCLEDELASARD